MTDEYALGRFASLLRCALIWTAWPVLILATASALISWFAHRDPRADIVNNVLPLWLLGGGVAAIVIVAGRGLGFSRRTGGDGIQGRLALFCAAVFLSSGMPPVARETIAAWQDSRIPMPVRALRLTLLQFNVLKVNATPCVVAAWVLREQPDIITMEETLGRNRSILDRLRPLYPYQTSCLSRMRCSTVILSRTKPLASGGLAQGDPENQGALSAAWARFAGAGGPFTVVAVHFVRPWPWGDQRSGRRQLATFLGTIDRRRAIVAGDFNLTPWTAAMPDQDRMFGLQRQTRFLPTWPAMIYGMATPAVMPIDHVYAGKDWQTDEIRRGPALGSDHHPLLATFRDAGSSASR
jgi:endonuclease/exonuclease/phosphatase (EEP) superfamily protein YafD